MDLQRVAVFAKVVEEGSFTAAAKSLSLPKSSVSRAVSLLEDELGARLLRRSTRSLALTEAGAAFYSRASRGLAAVAEARDAVRDLATEMRGPIRITASVDTGVWILSPLIAAFTAQHPGVLVDAVLTARVVDVTEEGFDLALRIGAVRDEKLVARKLPPLDFGLYASTRYLERAGRPSRVTDLSSHRCVLFREPRGRATWTLVGPRGEERVDVSGAINADDFAFALQTVAADAGVGLLPRFVAESAGAERVERVLPEHGTPGSAVHLVYPGDRYMPQRVAALRDFIVAELTRPRAPAAPARREARPRRRR